MDNKDRTNPPTSKLFHPLEGDYRGAFDFVAEKIVKG